MPRDQILDHQVNDEKSKKVEKKGLQSEKDNQGKRKRRRVIKRRLTGTQKKRTLENFYLKNIN